MVPAYIPVTLRLTRQAGYSEITAIAERIGEGEWRISASLILLAAHGVVQAVHEAELPYPLSARSDVEAASFAMEKAIRLLERIEKHAR